MASASRSHRIRRAEAAPVAALLAIALGPAPAGAQGEPVIFSATGDYPYGSSEEADLIEHVDLHNLHSPSDFFVHVGDINAGSETCTEARSIFVKEELTRLAVPAFCLIGDNEWTDCSNPDRAWDWYVEHLANMDAYFCYPWELERQSVRDENWAFVHKGVLFAGINIPNGDGGNKEERLQDDADWVDFQMVDKKSQVRAAVIFGHTGPGGSHDLFFDQFEESSATFGKPVLYVMGDKHSWQYDSPFSESNMRRLVVEQGGHEQPVEITVKMSGNPPWEFHRDPWNGSPPEFDHEPCVDVGPDRSIDVSETLGLAALVQDDGGASVQWTKESGAGTVTFGSPGQESTTAQFGSGGLYEIRCTADDGTNVTWDELLVDVNGAGAAYLTIADVDVTEGDSGTLSAVFDVVLSGSPSGSVSVDYATADSSAESSSDYDETTGTLTFHSTTTKTVSVPVRGDTDVEPDEVFFVNLFGATNGAVITKSQGRGLIRNDDEPPPNDPPSAAPDLYATAEDETLAVAAPGVLDNDTDPDGNPLTASVTSPPGHGAVSLAADGSFTYVPNADWFGFEMFSYEAADGLGAFDTSTVVVEVTAVNDSPAVADDSYSTGLDETLAVPAPGVLANDADVDDPSFTAVLEAGPANGALSLAADGSFSFDPDPQFFGADSFSYRADDGKDPSAVATVRISVGAPEETVFHPTDDTFAKISTSTRTYGAEDILRIRGGTSAYASWLKFDLSGVGTVTTATLRLHVTDYGTDGTCHVVGNDYAGTNTPWQEEDLYYDIAPPLGAPFAPISPPAPGNWLEVDVTSVVTGPGVYSFGLAGTVDNSTRFSSKEGAFPPELVVTAYTGGPVPEPDVTAAPLAHAWGDVTVGGSSSRSFVIGNDGDADLHVGAVAITGPDASEFTTGAGPFTVAPGGSQTVDVTFAPASSGAKSATLQLTSDDPDESPLDLALSGNGVTIPVPDVAADPASVDFGDVVVGESAGATVLIRNVGSAELSVASVALVGADPADFAIVSGAGAFALAPGDSHAVEVGFAPVGLGPRSASLRIASDDPDENPLDVPLGGTGVAVPVPDIAVSPASLDFGDVWEGTSASLAVEVRNDGTADLAVAAPTLVGPDAPEFAITAGGGAFTLAPGGTRTVEVTFAPLGPGAVTASLRLASDDPDEDPLDVALAGTGVELPAGGGEIAFEGFVTGGALRVESVTSDPVPAPAIGAPTDLYLAVISTKSHQTVTGVSGLGLPWTLVREQCGARQQTGLAVFRAMGPTAGGSVTASLGGTAGAAAITVLRYSGVDVVSPVGAVVTGNTQGIEGSCDGGSDEAAYDLPITTTTPGSVVCSSVALRRRTHEPAAGWTERLEYRVGSGGTVAGIGVMDQAAPAPGPLSVAGTFNKSVDWSLVAIELRPGAVVDAPDIASAPAAWDFGDLVAGAGTASRVFRISNAGTVDLAVTASTLTGPDADEFSIDAGGGAFVLAPGETRDVTVSFAPASLGAKTAALSFASDDPDENPFAVPLAGRGVDEPTPDIAVTPASHDFGDVFEGTSVSHTFQVRNDGSADLAVTATDVLGADAAEFGIDAGGGAATIAPGATRDLTVSFWPSSLGARSATLRISSDDPDEPTIDVPLAGVGVEAPVGGGEIVLEEVLGGGSTSSHVVSTTGDVTAVGTHLYLAAVSSKKSREVVAVEGLGLAWSPVVSQCAARDQTAIAVWMAQGTPGASGPVTATLASSADNAVIVVSRWSGAQAVGAATAANTAGVGAGCSDGTDTAAYSFGMTTSAANAVIVTAAAMRSKDHLPGAGWTERLELHQGTGGATCGVSVADRKFESAGAVTVEGAFSRDVDWAVAAVELRPAPAVGIVQVGRDGLAPDAGAPELPALSPSAPAPRSLALGAPRPNPFRRDVTVELQLPAAADVELVVYDAAGRVVRRLLGGRRAAGVHEARWDGRDAWGLRVASGVYFVRLTAGPEARLRKIVLAR